MMRAIDQKTYPIKLPALLRWLFLFGLFQFVFISSGNAQSLSLPVDSGVVLWLDAQDSSNFNLSNDSVHTWMDKSGLGNHAVQNTIARQPTYITAGLNNKPIVRFAGKTIADGDGFYNYLVVPNGAVSPISGEITMFIVSSTDEIMRSSLIATFDPAIPGNPQSTERIGLHHPWDNSYIYWDFGYYTTTGRVSTPWNAAWTQNPFVWTFLADKSRNSGSGYMEIRQNGSLLNSSNQSDQFNDPISGGSKLNIGRQSSGNSDQAFKGDVAEIIIYNKGLSNAEREQVEEYLNVKWGASEISTDENTRKAGSETAQVSVQLRDMDGNALALENINVRFTTTQGLLNGGASSQVVQTNASGVASVTLSSSTKGVAEIIAEIDIEGDYQMVKNGGDSGVIEVVFTDAIPVDDSVVLWLDASEQTFVSQSSGQVSTWMDLSGLGNSATQATSARRPVYVTNGINGKPSVRFAGGLESDGDGFHSYLVTPKGAVSPISNAITVLMVVNQKTHNSKQGILATFDPANPSTALPQSPRIILHLPWSNPSIYWDFGNTSTGRISSPWNTSWTRKPTVWSFLADKTRNSGTGYMEYRRDGGLLNSKNSSIAYSDIASGNAFSIGRHEGVSGTPAFWGDIAEIIIYNRGLSPTELANMEEYLRKKWGFHEFYSLADGNVGSLGSWTHYPGFTGDASNFAKDEVPFAPDATDTLHIGNTRTITLASNFTSNGKINVEDSGRLLTGTNTISGTAAFNLQEGGTLGIGSTAGITGSGASGNIQVSGTRTFSEQANYTYNGTAAQATGNGLPETVNDLVINNTSGVTAESDHIINGQLILEDGLFTMPAGSSLVVANDSITTTSGSVRMQHNIDGNKGWRMVSSPVSTNYEDLLNGFVTQNFEGSDFPDLAPNLLWFDETDGGTTLQGWRQPGNSTDPVLAGQGHFHYVFDGAGRPDGSSNYTDTLPLTMSTTGIENAFTGGDFNFDVTFTSRDASAGETTDSTWVDINEADEGWNLVGNPTMATLDWDASAGWNKENIDATIYVWNPAANGGNGDYLVWNGVTGTLSNGRIAPFQAFWVHANDASPQLALNDNVKTTGGEYVGGSAAKTNSSAQKQAVVLPLKLEANGWESQSYITLMEQGNAGQDPRDAYRLQPMTESWLNLFTMSEENLPLVINNLPLEFEKNLELPLQVGGMVQGSPYSGEFTLRWDIPKNWPEDIQVALVDRKTGTAVSLLETADYTFNYKTPVTAAKVDKKEVSIIPVLPESVVFGKDIGKAKKKTSDQTRFLLRMSRGEAPVDIPEKITLYQNYPNPFNPVTTIRFSLPEKTNVRLEIFDLLGRRVATLINNELATGIHEVQWNALNYSSGIYLYRITTDTERRIKRMALIK